MRKAVIAIAMVGSTFTGGVIGAALFAGGRGKRRDYSVHHSCRGGHPSTEPARSIQMRTLTHEAGKAWRGKEAQEYAGQMPTVPETSESTALQPPIEGAQCIAVTAAPG